MRWAILLIMLLSLPAVAALSMDELTQATVWIEDHTQDIDRSQYPIELGDYKNMTVIERYIPDHGIILAFRSVGTARECVSIGQPLFIRGRYTACIPRLEPTYEGNPLAWSIDELDFFFQGLWPTNLIILVMIIIATLIVLKSFSRH